MRYSTYKPPSFPYNRYICLNHKVRISPPTPLISRSLARLKFYNRTNPLNLTKTRPPCSFNTNLRLFPISTSCPRTFINSSGGLRGFKPNTASQNSCVLLYCSSWMNYFNYTLFKTPFFNNVHYLYNYNNSPFHSFFFNTSKKRKYPFYFLKQDPYFVLFIALKPSFTRGLTPAHRLYTKMAHSSRINKTSFSPHSHNSCNIRSTKSLLLPPPVVHNNTHHPPLKYAYYPFMIFLKPSTFFISHSPYCFFPLFTSPSTITFIIFYMLET